MSTARKLATYEDLLDAPEHLVAELIHGSVHTTPRPGPRHASAAMLLGAGLHGPFDRGRGGPGGWLILIEPELHLGEHVLVPDLAGWRRERMPSLPDAAYFSLAPDWVCEVSATNKTPGPSTAKLDRSVKLPIYAQHKIGYAWILDPTTRLLEVLQLQTRGWLLLDTFVGEDVVRPAPFDAVPFDLAELWRA